jgi:hypothetical protein
VGDVIGVAAMESHEIPALSRGCTATLPDGQPVSLTMDGLIYATSIAMPYSPWRKVPVPVLARWLLGLGVAATLAANVAHDSLGNAWRVPQRPRGRWSHWSAPMSCS